MPNEPLVGVRVLSPYQTSTARRIRPVGSKPKRKERRIWRREEARAANDATGGAPSKPSGKRAGSRGANFIDHEINVRAGEDVASVIISLSCEERREISVISAEGTILDAALTDAGKFLLIPGHFRILSFFGGCKPIKIKEAKNVVRSRFRVSLEAADGGVIRGIVALPFTALSPVKVVMRISIPGTQHEPKTKPTRAAKKTK